MTAAVVLAVTGLLLVVLAWATARRPLHEISDKEGYFDRWAVLHGGYDPRTGNPWLRGWLTMVYTVARPLARRGISPDVLTISSIWLAGAVFLPLELGGRWAILAGWVLVVSGLFDTLDGCVAALENRTSRWGYVLDSAVDRVNDVVYLVAVVSVGAPPGLAVACGFLFFFLEYVRARAGNAGGGDVGRITVAERPSRVIVLAASLHFGGVFLGYRELVATIGMALIALLTLVGVGQLLIAVRRQLLDLPDEPAVQVPEA
ncbi:MAG: CDP-alcohol phosphatidyltransferase family protein [Mycobacteriales bacterium]